MRSSISTGRVSLSLYKTQEEMSRTRTISNQKTECAHPYRLGKRPAGPPHMDQHRDGSEAGCTADGKATAPSGVQASSPGSDKLASWPDIGIRLIEEGRDCSGMRES
jgi:hypothetical protein